jgi:hypothetical protein
MAFGTGSKPRLNHFSEAKKAVLPDMFKFSHISPIPSLRTGGLIPIMLGLLQMSVDACIEAYISLSDKVFQKKSSHRVNLKGRLRVDLTRLSLRSLSNRSW